MNRAVHGRDELDPKRERVRGRRVRDRDRDPTTVGRPRRSALGRRRRDERPGSARRHVHHRHVGPHPIVPRRRGRVREGNRGAVRRPVERWTTHPCTHMPAHLHVLRREQPGDPAGCIPRHVDQIEAREPLPLAHHARVAHRHGRVREHERHPAAVRRPAKLTQLPLPGHVREPLRPPRAVERHTPHVPLPRSARGEREPAPVRRPGRGARRRLDPPGGLLAGATDGIHVHGRPPLTRLRLHERLGHLDRRPAPIRRDHHAPHTFDRERQLGRPPGHRALRPSRDEQHKQAPSGDSGGAAPRGVVVWSRQRGVELAGWHRWMIARLRA